MKAIIVGAGIAGLSVAWRLAREGMEVEILDRGLAGQGATWAAAGMLAPVAEFGTDDSAIARFGYAAREAWPDFAAEIEAASGHDIGFRADGSLTVAGSETRAETLQALASALRAQGRKASWLPRSELPAREYLLSPSLLGGLYAPIDAQIDNRALAAALLSCLSRWKVELREHCDVRSWFIERERIKGVITSQGSIAADIVVLAAGAWMNRIEGSQNAVLPPVKPIKGQMMSLAVPDGAAPPRALIWGDDVYLVPRRGRLFLGATVEDAGFDLSVTAEARNTLLAAAQRIIPGLVSWNLSEVWAGLRPHVSDGRPIAGSTSVTGLYVLGGQFRNGILFAPLLADLLRRSILGEPQDVFAAAFDPQRFSSAG